MWYDVRYWQYQPLDNLGYEQEPYKDWCKTPASSDDDALETFTRYQKNATAIKAVPLKHEWDTRDKGYWFEKWRDAMANMPFKIMQHKHREWLILPKGTTPLPEFIEGRAKGTMRQHEGQTWEEHITYSSHEYGRAAALGILLGYITWTGKDHKRKRANSCAMLGRKIPERSRPRDPKVRELLAKLGTMPKDEIKKLLDRKRNEMKHGTRV
jgi:hypothetical protein